MKNNTKKANNQKMIFLCAKSQLVEGDQLKIFLLQFGTTATSPNLAHFNKNNMSKNNIINIQKILKLYNRQKPTVSP